VTLPPAETDAEKLEEAQRYYDEGKRAFDNQAWQEAISSFDRALALDPRHAEAYNYRGAAIRHIGYTNTLLEAYLAHQDLAIVDFTRAIAADPSWWRAYYNRGNSYERRGQVEPLRDDRRKWNDLAFADYVRARELDPTQAWPHGGLAALYIGQGQYDQALAELEKSQPWATDAVSIAVSAYLCKGSLGEAMDLIQRTLDSDPGNPVLYLQRSSVYLERGEYAKALDDANKAAELWGGPFVNAGVWFQKAAVEYHLGHYDQAEEYIKTGRRYTWQDWGEPYYYLGMIYLQRGQPDAAVVALTWAEQTMNEGEPELAETRAELDRLQ